MQSGHLPCSSVNLARTSTSFSIARSSSTVHMSTSASSLSRLLLSLLLLRCSCSISSSDLDSKSHSMSESSRERLGGPACHSEYSARRLGIKSVGSDAARRWCPRVPHEGPSSAILLFCPSCAKGRPASGMAGRIARNFGTGGSGGVTAVCWAGQRRRARLGTAATTRPGPPNAASLEVNLLSGVNRATSSRGKASHCV